MSSFNLNRVQKEAVENININLSLRAGAGTGKTKVLTERFLNILKNGNLTEGHEFDEVLAITFTNKASAEMKGRILQALRDRKDEEKFKNLYKYFSKANIYTIHGFCSNIIKENPLVAEVDPNFKIADERISAVLLKESAEETLKSRIEDNLFLEFLQKRDDMNLNMLQEELVDLYNSLRSNSYTIDQIYKYHKDYIKKIKEPDYSVLITYLYEYSKIVKTGKFPKFYNSDEFNDFVKKPEILFLSEIPDNLGTSKGEDKEELRNQINQEIDSIKESLELENEKYYELIFSILQEIEKRYSEKKNQKSLLDYNDLQFKALKVIKQTDLYNYKYIMIDEFQDTDRLQAEIFKALSSLGGKKDAKVFVVGDPKQSIYSFRGSSLKEYYRFTDLIKSKGTELVMEENYRSSKSLIDFFNEVFSRLLIDDYDSLLAKSNVKENIQIEVLKSDFEEENKHRKEAVIVANRVKQLIKEGEDPKEIAVLFRRKMYIDLFEEEMIKLGIPVNNTAVNFTAKTEIKDVLILLKAVSNKRDFLSFMSYLRSPMAGLNDNSLVIIAKYFNRDEFVLDDKYINLLEDRERVLYKRAYGKLIKLKEIRPLLSLRDFIKKAIEETDYFEISSLIFGNTAGKNLSKLLDIAEDFEKEISSNIVEFFTYLEDSENDIEEDENSVNLITIHKSKGLEFNNVIIAEMDKKINSSGNRNFFEFSNRGLAFNFDFENAKYNKIIKDKKELDLEEELRMFYVATTRAKKRLIISYVNIEDKIPANTYAELFEKSEFKNLREYILNDLENGSKEIKLIPEDILKAEPVLDEKSLVRNTYLNKIKKVKYYSASSFMSFKRDKEEYFRKYILAEEYITHNNYATENKILDPIIRGNIVHKYAETEPEDIDGFIKKSLRNYGILESEENINLLKEQFVNYETSLTGKVLYRELEFYYPIKKGIIHGFIDQIREEEKEAVIVDFKTSYKSSEEILQYYAPQLQIYTKAFEEITGKKVKKAKLLFLSTNEEFEVDISEEKIKKIIEEFNDYIEFVENHREFKDYI